MMHYSIISIDDRSKEQIKKTKKILHKFKYVDNIKIFNGIKNDGKRELENLNIKTNVWNPYDGRKSLPLPGEYGAFVTKVNTLKYIVENNIDYFLFIEDDIIVSEYFYKNFNICFKELPKDFDFLSLYYFKEHNQITKESDVGLKFIHKSINQYSGTQIILYSYNGAKKILKLIDEKGMEYTADCFIFKQSQLNLLNGYSIKPNSLIFGKQNLKLNSLIDPENKRSM
jgi:GR25 family glycosyltransferase involved in LPS biosynthesis